MSAGPVITDTRRLTVKRMLTVMAGSVEWVVNEFDDGRAYLLSATSLDGSLQFSAHFTGDQWAEFQRMVRP